jgi:transposase
MPANGYHPVELRVQILTLYGLGFKTLDIASYLEVPPRTIQELIKKAKARGYKPEESLRVKKEYFEDSKRSGRPKEITPAIESSILQSISKDRAGREKSSEILAFEAGISSSSVLRILHSYGLNNAKPSTKPGLTDAMKAKRLEYCLQNPWTDDSIKDLIFTDETAVVLGQRRGAVRVWRTPEDQYNQTCIRRRWKGCSEFMVWACFSWDSKGPLYIYDPESALQRRNADKAIEEMNKDLEPVYRQEWELNTALRRLQLRPRGGRKPEFQWNEKNGKLVRKGKGGVDWYRYQKVWFFFIYNLFIISNFWATLGGFNSPSYPFRETLQGGTAVYTSSRG